MGRVTNQPTLWERGYEILASGQEFTEPQMMTESHMVLISRKEEDTIPIGRDVSVTVIRASNGEVLLGVKVI